MPIRSYLSNFILTLKIDDIGEKGLSFCLNFHIE